MNPCPRPSVLQDHLEGLLPAGEARRVADHVADCAACAREAALLRRLLTGLDAIPLATPSNGMADRVLDLVLPGRRRERWARRFGWGYAGATAASLVAVGGWLLQPSSRAFLAWLAGEAPSRAVHALAFVIQGLAFLALQLAGSWGILSALGGQALSFARLLLTLTGPQVVMVVLAITATAGLALIWWLRARPERNGREVTHVGVVWI